MGEEERTSTRRPLKSRNLVVFQSMASWMVKRGISPNSISISSMVFAIAAGGAMYATAGAEDGPFCTACWDVRQQKVRLRKLAADFADVASDESLARFFRRFFDHEYRPGRAPAHASGSRGWEYYCATGEVSAATRDLVEGSANAAAYREILAADT